MKINIALGLACLLSIGCSARSPSFRQAQQEARRGNWEAAVSLYEKARSDDPENLAYRMALQRARLEAAHESARDARRLLAEGDIRGAIDTFERSIGYDPTNEYVRAELSEIRGQALTPSRFVSTVRARSLLGLPEPVLDKGSDAPLRLSFAPGTSLRTVLEALGKLAGINVLFDEAFRDAPIDVELEGVTFREALDILGMTHRFFYKPVRSQTVLVAPQRND